MMRRALRLLAIDLSAKGFGFALVDAKLGLLDHGFTTMLAHEDGVFTSRLSTLIERGRPSTLVLENLQAAKGRETAIRRQSLAIKLVEGRIGLCFVSRIVVRRVFGEETKAAIARAVAVRFPELERRRPVTRKPWQSEDVRMNVFDAVALALTILGPTGESSK